MFKVATEKEFLDAFRPRDRSFVEPPPDARFPLIIRDYLAWSDPSGTRRFLVFTAPDAPHATGLVFRVSPSRDERGARLCEWCHAFGGGDQIGLLSADVNSRRRVGISVCLDLQCGTRIEEAADRAGKNPRVLARELIARMARFTREALGITATSREPPHPGASSV